MAQVAVGTGEIELPRVLNEGRSNVAEVRPLLTVWQTPAFNFGTHISIMRPALKIDSFLDPGVLSQDPLYIR